MTPPVTPSPTAEEAQAALEAISKLLKIHHGHDSYANLKFNYGEQWWDGVKPVVAGIEDVRDCLTTSSQSIAELEAENARLKGERDAFEMGSKDTAEHYDALKADYDALRSRLEAAERIMQPFAKIAHICRPNERQNGDVVYVVAGLRGEARILFSDCDAAAEWSKGR